MRWVIGEAAVLVAIGLMLLTSSGCKKETIPMPCKFSYECMLKRGGTFEDFENKKEIINQTVSTYSNNGQKIKGKEAMPLNLDSGNWVCTTTTYHILQGEPDFPVYNHNASVIYPGALLQGISLEKGTPDPIPLKRKGGTFSIDLLNGSFITKVSVPVVSKSAVTQALNDIIYYNNGIMPARFYFTYNKVRTNEEIALLLNLNLDIYGINFGGLFKVSDKSEYHNYLITLKQTFYTITFDTPTNYADFFDNSIKPADLAMYVYQGNPACYISDVTYGRVFYMLLESTSNESEIEAAISGSFGGIGNGGFSINNLSQLENLKIKMYALGGDISGTFQTFTSSNLNSLAFYLTQSSDIRTAVPLSYSVRTILKDKLVKHKLDLIYDVTDCKLQ